MPSRKVILKNLLRYSLIAFGLVVLAVGIWIGYLDHIVGQALTADGLERELRSLGYRRSENPHEAGSYRRRDVRVDFISRPFHFIDEERPTRAMSVLTGKQGIERMWDGAGKEEPVFRLDPMLIGSIFPIHGEDRVIVTPEQVPPMLPAALKIVED